MLLWVARVAQPDRCAPVAPQRAREAGYTRVVSLLEKPRSTRWMQKTIAAAGRLAATAGGHIELIQRADYNLLRNMADSRQRTCGDMLRGYANSLQLGVRRFTLASLASVSGGVMAVLMLMFQLVRGVVSLATWCVGTIKVCTAGKRCVTHSKTTRQPTPLASRPLFCPSAWVLWCSV